MRLSSSRITALTHRPQQDFPLWDKAGTRPSLDLQFADRKDLVDATTGSNLVDFTRASSGTYVGSDGLIKTATTNLLLQSEDFSTTWGATNTSVSADSAIAPNGLQSADTHVPDNATTLISAHVNQTVTKPASALTYTASVYAKAAGLNRALLFVSGASTADRALVTISLVDGSVAVAAATVGAFSSASSTQANAGDGWYKITLTFTSSTETSLSFRVYTADSALTTGDGTSGIYIWGAQLEQSTTVGEYVKTTSTINSAPRFDHDPTTGESLGLLVEEARTNSIRNNTMVGAVAGTPGTLPTNWSGTGSGNGLTREIVEIGTEDGISYIDVKFSGTPTAGTNASVAFEPLNQVTASQNQAWTESTYLKLQAGSFTNTSVTISLLGTNGITGTEEIASSTIASTPASLKDCRLSASGTFASASTTHAYPRVRIGFTVGAAIDITLRIGLPQLEQGAFATSVIPTEGSTVTRAADVASISGSNFSSWYRQDEGTVFASFDSATNRSYSGTFRHILQITPAANNNSSVGVLVTATNSYQFQVRDNNSNVATPVTGTNSGLRSLVSAGYKVDDFAVAANGGSPVTDTSGAAPATEAPTQMIIGGVRDGNVLGTLNNTIRRLTYWPQRLPNETLQTITQ